MKFEDLQFNSVNGGFGIQAITEFDGPYNASIIKGHSSYGSSEGLYELAVLYNGQLCYDTPITNDVVGYLTEEDVEKLLNKVKELNSPLHKALEGK